MAWLMTGKTMRFMFVFSVDDVDDWLFAEETEEDCCISTVVFELIISTVRCSYIRYIQRSNPILPSLPSTYSFECSISFNGDLKHSKIVRVLSEYCQSIVRVL